MERLEPSFRRTLTWLVRPVDPLGLQFFRAIFGAVMAFYYFDLWYSGQFRARFLLPEFFFPHWSFFPILPDGVWWIILVSALVSSLLLSLGRWSRGAGLLLFLSSGCMWITDVSYWNNHYYLQSLLALLFAFTGSNNQRRAIPGWHLDLFRFQICLVYFYGGIAKIQADWLGAVPISIWFERKAQASQQPLLSEAAVHYLAAYGGLYLDLLAPFFLLWSPGRSVFIPLILLFHVLNSQLFTIGVFPYMMLGTIFLFVDMALVKSYFPKLRKPNAGQDFVLRPVILGLLFVYLIFQVLLPLRIHFYPGDPSWNDRGQWFSWRMMLRTKQPLALQFVLEKDGTLVQIAKPAQGLNNKQMRSLTTSAIMQQRLAEHLAERYDGVVYVRGLVKLNDREPSPLIDPKVGFTSQGPTSPDFLTERPNRQGRLSLPKVVFDAQWLVLLVLSLWACRAFRSVHWIIPSLLALPAFLLTQLSLLALSFLALLGLAVRGCRGGQWLSLPFALVVSAPLIVACFILLST